MPAPTQDELDQQDKRMAMSGKTSGGAISIVIPEIPYQPLPPVTAKKFPDLDEWNRNNHAALMQWRERTNSVFARVPETPVVDPPVVVPLP